MLHDLNGSPEVSPLQCAARPPRNSPPLSWIGPKVWTCYDKQADFTHKTDIFQATKMGFSLSNCYQWCSWKSSDIPIASLQLSGRRLVVSSSVKTLTTSLGIIMDYPHRTRLELGSHIWILIPVEEGNDSRRAGCINWVIFQDPLYDDNWLRGILYIIEGSLEAKLPTIWTDEKQSREEAERRDRSEEKRSEERRCRCAKR